MSVTDSVLLRDFDNGVLTLTWNRPEQRNGWNADLEQAYFSALDDAESDDAVRAIVVTGAGKTFCPGVDSSRMDAAAGKPLDLSARRPFHRPLQVRKPMIAAINGACAGVGVVLALQCDIRFAARGIRFATSFARRGLPAERGIAWLLPRLIGPERALDLLMSGRPFDADEALSLGVVSRLSAPDEVVGDAQQYALMLATECSPTAMAVIKHQVHSDLFSDFESSYQRADRALTALAAGPDCREGVDAFLQRRAPQFPALPADFRPDSLLGD
ncbi:enoyl-CoA hydratase/isomerase family protein [Mycolicibacterium fluoranthenivorans]|uniref:Enoyl-CoA hydratase/isomerase family protein n=1 Tax=Mycolicibacterium fluoranthenivorans TaxID=258505 RepID=A0A7G8PG88_9MYCO|nr:enoyl-CoA hydratase-related protein [Mycolicibacterium fluoranthenivorans]QNJ93354.1 enoyl-CoA hydratase/isomerase family protein [Mycolicibacterium fluoranthenivorans]